MEKFKTYVFSALVILIVSFSDEAESKSMEIDRRLERAVEKWRKGTSLAQAQDTDTSDTDGGIQISRREADNTNAVTGSNRQAVRDPETGIRYGCNYMAYHGSSFCWRSCEKGVHFKEGKNGSQEDLCVYSDSRGYDWCYSDLGICSFSWGCQEAVKWGCYGTGSEPERHIPAFRERGWCPMGGGYLCDTETRRSFGCEITILWGTGRCWRSCDAEENLCNNYIDSEKKKGWCPVDAGICSYNGRCIVATALDCVRDD